MENQKSLILDLENAVLALEQHYSIDEIFAFVNMINRGFIVNGAFSEIYLEHVNGLLRQQAISETHRTVDQPLDLVDTRGNAIQ
jgi:hypothetical protein